MINSNSDPELAIISLIDEVKFSRHVFPACIKSSRKVTNNTAMVRKNIYQINKKLILNLSLIVMIGVDELHNFQKCYNLFDISH